MSSLYILLLLLSFCVESEIGLLEPEPEAGAGGEDVVNEDRRGIRLECVSPVVREDRAGIERHALIQPIGDQPAPRVDVTTEVMRGQRRPGIESRQANPNVGQAPVQFLRKVVVKPEMGD